VHASQITYANIKTPQEQDVAKMNAVEWQNPDTQYWRMWFYMSHVSTSYTVRLGCAADCDPRWWTSCVVRKSKLEWKPQAAHCNMSFWLQEAMLSAEESLFHLQFNELQIVWDERKIVIFKLFAGFACVSVTVLFDVYTLHYMWTLPIDFTLLDDLLFWRTGQELWLDGQNACQKQRVF
jgi:hypothetical protein